VNAKTSLKCVSCPEFDATHNIHTRWGQVAACDHCAIRYAEMMAAGFPVQGIAHREPEVSFVIRVAAHGMLREIITETLKDALEQMKRPQDLASKCAFAMDDHTVELWMTMELLEIQATRTFRLL
jgi:hypothetical protein